MAKDAKKRYEDRKIRREKADTLKTKAMKAFRRGEFEKALSCYNKAMEFVKDDAMLLCDRALTNIKLGRYEQVLWFIKPSVILLITSYDLAPGLQRQRPRNWLIIIMKWAELVCSCLRSSLCEEIYKMSATDLKCMFMTGNVKHFNINAYHLICFRPRKQ